MQAAVEIKLSVCCLQHNKFKQRIINEKVDTPTTTVYRSVMYTCDYDMITHLLLAMLLKLLSLITVSYNAERVEL